jgi:hypothetical protein
MRAGARREAADRGPEPTRRASSSSAAHRRLRQSERSDSPYILATSRALSLPSGCGTLQAISFGDRLAARRDVLAGIGCAEGAYVWPLLHDRLHAALALFLGEAATSVDAGPSSLGVWGLCVSDSGRAAMDQAKKVKVWSCFAVSDTQ